MTNLCVRIAIVVALSNIGGLSGWNDEGHQIVAKIALAFTRPRTDTFVSRILGESAETSMIRFSSWADTITDRRPETARMHFSHTPYRACDVYDRYRDCPSGDCIVESITRLASVASSADASQIERREAVLFLIHLVADIHQPLHVGFRNDSGGTHINFPPTDLTLHKLWDYDILNTFIARNHGNSWENLASHLIDSDSVSVFRGNYIMNPGLLDDGEFASSIATETSQMYTCSYAYKDVDSRWINDGDAKPGRDYYQSRFRIISRQLLKAGVRLAQLLDYVTDMYRENVPSTRAQSAAAAVYDKHPDVVSAPAIPYKNRFAVLVDLDVDIDDIAITYVSGPPNACDEMIPDEDPVPDQSTGAAAASVSRSPKKKSSPKKRSCRPIARQPLILDGIRVDDLVIVKRRSRLYVTYASQVRDQSANWGPISSIPIEVRFRNDEESRIFHLDGEIFRFTMEPSREFLTRLFGALSGKSAPEAAGAIPAQEQVPGAPVEVGLYHSEREKKSPVSVMLGCGMSSSDYDDMQVARLREAERLYTESRSHMTSTEIARETRVRNKRSNEKFRNFIENLVFVSADRILLVTTFEKAIDTGNTSLTVNRFDYSPVHAKSPDDNNILYIDTAIFNDEMTPEIFATITQLRKKEDYVTRTLLAIRANRLLYDQLKQLSDAIFKTDYSRGPAVINTFKNFEKVIRFDKPYLRTFLIDYARLDRSTTRKVPLP